MMKMTYCSAIREALYKELEYDSNVILLGEDIEHDVYRYTGGLVEKFGREISVWRSVPGAINDYGRCHLWKKCGSAAF